ncbi:COG4223 family protein [Rhodobacter capsulatus]|uniref:COG4223 family protein n=1 Tax=Rhodobacter capsulatus TaxID=1061 RepID=UPI0040298EB8
MPEALKGDLPSIAALKAAFPEGARKALTTARKATAGETMTDRLGSFLLAQTGARSLTAKDGTGPDAVLSRAQTAVDAAQFDAALTEIAALPEAAQADLQPWKDMVAKRASAQAAIADLTQSVQ